MKYILFIIISLNLISDEGDIVQRKTLDLDSYNQNINSFCKPKPSPEHSVWLEDFLKPSLSVLEWNYSITNGFYEGRKYISGWGNGELQY